jgi:hypothetical protein
LVPNDSIEGPAFLEVRGDVRRQRMLDLGCGDASFGRYLIDAGALSYLGEDASASIVARRTDAACPACATSESKHSPLIAAA